MKNKLIPAQILKKASNKYFQIKISKHIPADMIEMEIQSDEIRAVVEALCEEINKILD